MAKTRREFTAELKREAVALWETSGRPQMEIAAELGLQPSQLRRWQRLIQQGQLEGPSSSPAPMTITKAPPLLHRRTWRLRIRGCGESSSGLALSVTF